MPAAPSRAGAAWRPHRGGAPERCGAPQPGGVHRPPKKGRVGRLGRDGAESRAEAECRAAPRLAQLVVVVDIGDFRLVASLCSGVSSTPRSAVCVCRLVCPAEETEAV